MVVKTNIKKEEFINLLSEYDIGKLVYIKPIKKGTVQSNFLIKTTKGKFIFRYYENRKKNSVLFEANLIDYLNRKNYPCPAIYKNKKRKFIGIYKNKPYAIFEFVEGKHIEKPGKKQETELIKEVAKLHILTKNYKSPYTKYRWNYSKEFCKRIAIIKSKEINTKNSKEKLKWLLSELSRLKLPKSLPKGVCHCDFHFSNVLFSNGKFKALIDFDDANYTYLTYDLISLIEPFIFDHDTWIKYRNEDNVFDFKQSKKIVSEYMRYRHLTKDEKKYLFDVYKLSILIDCLWYFKRGYVVDFYEKRKIDYLNRLGRDNFYKEIFE